MADNKRLYACQALTVNGTALGGTTMLNIELGHEVSLEPEQDGLGGMPEGDDVGRVCRGRIACEDVTKFLTLLNSTPSALTFYGREATLATYGKGTLAAPKILGGQLDINRSGTQVRYTAMSLDFECIGASAADFDDFVQHADAQAAPSYTDAVRLMQPISATFGAFTVLHPLSLSVSVQPRQLLRRFGDDDLAITSIDILGRTVTVTFGFQDMTKQAGPPTHTIGTALVKAARGAMAVTVRAARGGANRVVTLQNCKFRQKGGTKTAGGDWESQAQGILGWLDDNGSTERTLGGANPIMTIA